MGFYDDGFWLGCISRGALDSLAGMMMGVDAE
jgi:hypothetical protein